MRRDRIHERILFSLALFLAFSGCVGKDAENDVQNTFRTPAIKDVEIIECEDIDAGERDLCLLNRARRTKDHKDCNNIRAQDLKFRCLAAVLKQARHCEKIVVEGEKDECFWDVAFGLNDRSFCDMISQGNMRQRCIYNYIMFKEPDAIACIDLTNITLRDRCIFDHIGRKTLDGRPYISSDLCRLIVDEELELRCNQTYLM